MIMQLAALRPIYQAQGPVATVYLQSQTAGANAEQQVRLRWDALRTQLTDAGADEQTVSALDDAVLGAENVGTIRTEGRVLVAGPSGLLLEEDFDATGAGGDRAVLGETAQLGDYLRQRLRSVRALVALVDQERAALRRLVLSSQEVPSTGPESSVEGSAVESVHKPRGGALKHRKIQGTADEAAKQNIRDVVEHIRRADARWNPDVLVIAGEVQGRSLLYEQLPSDLQQIAHQVEAGGGIAGDSADEGAEESLAEELSGLVRQLTVDRVAELTEQFGDARGNGLALEGAENVRRALQLGAVDTLLLRYGQSAEDDSRSGGDPDDPQDPAHHVVEDQLLRDAAEVDASVALVGAAVKENVAALLRYDAPVDQMDSAP
ncbi:hypothetical protein [Nesterenkonia sp.]|uniref:baeRF2 domain-containing protein n=1 Tax=Nesterenkonia sp. TaxID=704201 RepID=UPI00261F9238|nr:hypothetical protein [Nesterenkonia sp.]